MFKISLQTLFFITCDLYSKLLLNPVTIQKLVFPDPIEYKFLVGNHQSKPWWPYTFVVSCYII